MTDTPSTTLGLAFPVFKLLIVLLKEKTQICYLTLLGISFSIRKMGKQLLLTSYIALLEYQQIISVEIWKLHMMDPLSWNSSLRCFPRGLRTHQYCLLQVWNNLEDCRICLVAPMFVKMIKLKIYFADSKEQVSKKATWMQHFKIQESLEVNDHQHPEGEK